MTYLGDFWQDLARLHKRAELFPAATKGCPCPCHHGVETYHIAPCHPDGYTPPQYFQAPVIKGVKE